MNKHFTLCVALLGATLGMIGCAQTSRYVTAEHWHDDNSFFIAYTEYTKTNFVVTSSGSSTAHVIMCRAGADNTATCRPQVAVDRLLNPGEDIPDAPPAPAAAPAAAPAPEAAPAAAPAAEPQS
jgi:hypothetical protein